MGVTDVELDSEGVGVDVGVEDAIGVALWELEGDVEATGDADGEREEVGVTEDVVDGAGDTEVLAEGEAVAD